MKAKLTCLLLLATLLTGCGVTVTHKFDAAGDLEQELARLSVQPADETLEATGAKVEYVSLKVDEDEGYSPDFGDDEEQPAKTTADSAVCNCNCNCEVDNATIERIADAVEDRLKPYYEQQIQAAKANLAATKGSVVRTADPVGVASVTVDMWSADWCQACKTVDEDSFPAGVLNKIDYEKEKATGQSLRITKLPTFILRDKTTGAELKRYVGVFSWEQIKQSVPNQASYSAPMQSTYTSYTSSSTPATYSYGSTGSYSSHTNYASSGNYATYSSSESDVYGHLVRDHGYSPSQLQGKTLDQLEQLHTAAHNSTLRSTYAVRYKGRGKR